jgi:carbamoyl-phosphate synthase small subunit
VFFSNGPGDPAAADYAVEAMRGVLDAGLPVFGICFGSQILSLALGLTTYKLKYGHRGVNQPVMDLSTGKVYITSHNHGFAAALPTEETTAETGRWRHVPRGAREPFATPYGEGAITHVNLNDGVVEGIRLRDRPVFAVQYHPESAPGPHDAVDLFDQFCQSMSTVDVTSTGIERGRCHIDREGREGRGGRGGRGDRGGRGGREAEGETADA